METVSLVIMAAGIGSRFKDGIKQLTPVGPQGELIIDYSIYDAIRAGFNKVVFVIRKDLEETFRKTIAATWEGKIEIAFVHQEIDDIPPGFEEKRAKRLTPWGTGQAILCCKDVIDGPFAVINADDYYGPMAFEILYKWLMQGKEAKTKLNLCMVGFVLENTLSNNGTVTRGVCSVDENQTLLDIREVYKIEKSDEKAIGIHNDKRIEVDLKTTVSMNMWGYFSTIFEVLENRFVEFLKKYDPDSLQKQEFLLPIIVGELLEEEKVCVKVLESTDKWFGVTYLEDKEEVMKEIRKLIDTGMYPEKMA